MNSLLTQYYFRYASQDNVEKLFIQSGHLSVLYLDESSLSKLLAMSCESAAIDSLMD